MFPRKDTSMQSRTFLIHHSKWKQYWCFSLFYCTTDRTVKSSHQPPPPPPAVSLHSKLFVFQRGDPFVCLSPAALAPAVLPNAALVPGSRKAPGCCTRASPACCPPTCCRTLVTEEYFFIYRRCATFGFSTPQPSASTLNSFQLGQQYDLDIET